MPIPLATLIPLITAGIQGGSAIAGGAINRKQSRDDINRQNEYNKPINQLARLREAGLGYGALEGGHAGSQSTSLVPQTSGGSVAQAGDNLSRFITNTMSMKQMELLEEQIKTQKAVERKTWAEAWSAHTLAREADARVNEELAEYGFRNDTKPSNLEWSMRKEQESKAISVDIQRMHKLIADKEYVLKSIDAQVQKDLQAGGYIHAETITRIENVLLQNGILQQAERRGAVMDRLITAMEKSGGGMSTSEAFFHSIMQGTFGGISQMSNIFK